MRRACRLPCLLCLLVLGAMVARSAAEGESALQKLERFEHAMSKDKSAAEPWSVRGEPVRSAVFLLDDRQLASLGETLPARAVSLWRELLEATRRERAERNLAFGRRIEELVETARRTCQAARTEAELNVLQVELFSLRNELEAEPCNHPKVQGMIVRLERVAESVGKWQSMLEFQVAGYDKQADALRREVAPFFSGEVNHTGPMNVVAQGNPDGTVDVSWENPPGEYDDEEIEISCGTTAQGDWRVVAYLPPGSTQYQLPAHITPLTPKLPFADPPKPGQGGVVIRPMSAR